MSAARYDGIWRRALPHLQVRRNDVHTWYCYRFAEALVGFHAEARPEVVLPAILLHDTGWSTVPADRILEAFGPGMKHPELRRQHEVEGARIAREILEASGHPRDAIDAIVAIIDGHDTRPGPLSLDDALVKDADKLWRCTPFGLDTLREWFGSSTAGQLALLDAWCATRFFTDAARHMARGLLAALVAQCELRGDAGPRPIP